jgi:hypothetical protein
LKQELCSPQSHRGHREERKEGKKQRFDVRFRFGRDKPKMNAKFASEKEDEITRHFSEKLSFLLHQKARLAFFFNLVFSN